MADLLGVLVGGASTRMGGRPKGLLHGPDGQPLVSRLIAAGRAAGLEPVLVGPADPYADVAPEVRCIADDPPGIGPLGGLHALLCDAGDRRALLVACDMPYIDAEILARVACDPSPAPIVAARRSPDGPWEPLLARYDAPRVRPALERALAEGARSFQQLFGRLEIGELVFDDALGRALTDWDSPLDVC